MSELIQMRNRITALENEGETLKALIAAMKSSMFEVDRTLVAVSGALELYGNIDHWSKRYDRQGQNGRQIKAPLHKDGGDEARAALAKIKELRVNANGEVKYYYLIEGDEIMDGDEVLCGNHGWRDALWTSSVI